MSSNSILRDASDEQLALAVETNLFALFRAMSTLPNSEIEETTKLSRHLAFPTHPFYQGAWGTNLAPDEIEAAIHETIDWFKSRSAPFFFWWTGPTTKPDDIGKYLTALGLKDLDGEGKESANYIVSTAMGAPGMVANLHQMNETVLEKVPPGFEMSYVRDEKDLQDFKQVLIDGNDLPEPMADGWAQAARAFGIDQTPWRMALGKLNGEPVAVNMVFNGGGVVGAYGVTVVPSARGKGIGAAITLKPLLDTRDNDGYNYAVLFSTEMGTPVYQRIGFRMTDARINRYLWRNG